MTEQEILTNLLVKYDLACREVRTVLEDPFHTNHDSPAMKSARAAVVEACQDIWHFKVALAASKRPHKSYDQSR